MLRQRKREYALVTIGVLSLVLWGLPIRASAQSGAGADATATADSSTQLPVADIEAVFGVTGRIEPDGVLVIDLERTDISPVVFGVPLKPDAGFDSEINFQQVNKHEAIVKWEFALLDSEVTPVLDALFAQGLQPPTTNVNAIHNHFLELTPEVKYLHGTAVGDPVAIAQALRTALEQSNQPFVSSGPGDTQLPNEEITQTIGGMSEVSDSVLKVSVERKDTIKELGIRLKPSMQVESMFLFQAVDNGAAVNAEFVLLNEEVDAVARTLRAHGLFVMAIHNHELFIHPTLYYLHAFGTGDPLALAAAIRDALEQTNSKLQ